MRAWTKHKLRDTGSTIATRDIGGDTLRLGWHDGSNANYHAEWRSHYEIGETETEALNRIAHAAGLPSMRPPK